MQLLILNTFFCGCTKTTMKQTSVVQLLIYVQNEISKQIDTPNENFMFFRQNILAPNEIGYDSMS